jgi:hypothetical protein
VQREWAALVYGKYFPAPRAELQDEGEEEGDSVMLWKVIAKPKQRSREQRSREATKQERRERQQQEWAAAAAGQPNRTRSRDCLLQNTVDITAVDPIIIYGAYTIFGDTLEGE